MLSRETRWNILVLHYDRQFTPLEISKLIVTATHKVSERTVQRVIAQFEATGEVINHHITTTCKVTDTHIPHAQIAGSSARRPSNGHIDAEHRPLLYLIIEQDPWLYLDELVDRLNNHPMVLTRIYDIYHVFRQLALDGFSLTKMRKFAAEKNGRLRTRYWNFMTEEVWFPAQLVFIDETSKDGRTLRRDHGRSLKGKRIEQRETIMRGRRVSVLGVLAITGFVDFHWVVKGYSAEEFLYTVEYHVLPHLNPYPQHNSILVRSIVLHRVSPHGSSV